VEDVFGYVGRINLKPYKNGIKLINDLVWLLGSSLKELQFKPGRRFY
jgi:hypothetical protein